MKMSVMGTGYLGAVHATCMAELGHEVVGYDTDAAKIEALSSGRSPFFEPEFEEVLARALESGRLTFTSDAGAAVRGAAVHFVCVGTPQQSGSEAADLKFVDSAFRTVAELADRDGLIVGKSTVPVGTAERLAAGVGDHTTHHLEVGWNPEFLREGMAVADTLKPDRLVFGVTSEHAEKALMEVYASIIDAGTPYITTDLATAEMVKVAANSFLATKISFINAMAEVCEVVNADVVTLSRALGYDERIGRRFLNAGLGFGGGCLPKDIRAFSARAGELGASDALSFLREIDKINMRRRDKVVSVAAQMLGGDFLSTNIAVLGAAFKPNSDDVRDSPALNVAAAMHLKGSSVRVHDPKAVANARKRFPTLTYCDSADEACENADLIVLATEWDEYRQLDPVALRVKVRAPRLLDARNVLDLSYWASAGWTVRGLGRRRAHA
ncbi:MULTISPECIES: UDP-glucose/GDP-mannose dehydrogenase family protein [unclassified Mycobacterium]|uniref:UDP-glucose dehydrogenase family protein n=1 Tax=unclassified Mycobacterium TaxID=2642494 RepID=UPI0029C6076D|nr:MULTISPECIES: UDP-glucose/GDP-mannose dehydrogenase family protein [unclassified Mycobacterium]